MHFYNWGCIFQERILIKEMISTALPFITYYRCVLQTYYFFLMIKKVLLFISGVDVVASMTQYK